MEIDFCTSGNILNCIPFAKEVSCLKKSELLLFFMLCVFSVLCFGWKLEHYIRGMFHFNGLHFTCSAKRQAVGSIKVKVVTWPPP